MTEQEFENIFKQHNRAIFAYAYNLLDGDTEAAKDITAEVFIKFWELRYKGIIRPTAFLIKRTKWLCFDRYKKLKREIKKHGNADYLVDKEFNMQEKLESKERDTEIVFAKIKELAPLQRRVIELYISGLDTHEIAEQIDRKPQLVLNYKLDAIISLKRLLNLQ